MTGRVNLIGAKSLKWNFCIERSPCVFFFIESFRFDVDNFCVNLFRQASGDHVFNMGPLLAAPYEWTVPGEIHRMMSAAIRTGRHEVRLFAFVVKLVQFYIEERSE